jgi:dihydroneopterin aldolase
MDWGDRDLIARDVISFKNLSLPHPVLAPDAWSFTPSALASKTSTTLKAQPATVSMELLLKPQSFENAARDDSVNPVHTVHYGELSKAVRAKCFDGQGLDDVLRTIASLVADRPAVTSATVTIGLPKGSMTGQSTSIVKKLIRFHGDPMKGAMIVTSGTLAVTGIPLTCLIGVNANERTGKQPLILDYRVRFEAEGQTDDESTGAEANRGGRLSAAFAIETYLREVSRRERENGKHSFMIKFVIDYPFTNGENQIIEKTSFETLESLIEFAYSELRREILDEHLPGATVSMMLSKPRAIIFADAPTVEIHRIVPVAQLQQ